MNKIPAYLQHPRIVMGHDNYDTLSITKKVLAKKLHLEGKLTFNLYTDGLKVTLNPPFSYET